MPSLVYLPRHCFRSLQEIPRCTPDSVRISMVVKIAKLGEDRRYPPKYSSWHGCPSTQVIDLTLNLTFAPVSVRPSARAGIKSLQQCLVLLDRLPIAVDPRPTVDRKCHAVRDGRGGVCTKLIRAMLAVLEQALINAGHVGHG